MRVVTRQRRCFRRCMEEGSQDSGIPISNHVAPVRLQCGLAALCDAQPKETVCAEGWLRTSAWLWLKAMRVSGVAAVVCGIEPNAM